MVVIPDKVLVVDDDVAVATAHAALLRELGYDCRIQTDPIRVEKQLRAQPEIGLVLLDIRMTRLNGLELLKRIKLTSPQVGVVMATVVNDITLAVEATKSGAYNYLLKPLQVDRLRQVVSSYFANRPALLIDDARFATFITGCSQFHQIFEHLRSYAEAEVTVLIHGETGTGKELAAQLVHSLSPRADGPFVPVNVAAINPGLFESELFGHRRGSFTGALSDHKGYFEEAGDGTIFLDEIGELSPEQQRKLLRVLQFHRYCRVGEARERTLTARVVMATNRDLRHEMKEGRFRDDLYYRLAGHSISLPPLRERPGDVALLANYLLKKYRSQFGRAIEGFHPDTLRLLQQYDFPGNVRELDGIVSGAVLICSSPWITPDSLPRHVRAFEAGEPGDLHSVRIKTITSVMAQCNGNQTQAAKILGLSRSHLCRLLKQYRGLESRS